VTPSEHAPLGALTGAEEPLGAFRFVVPVATTDADYDAQGHLNNAAIVRLFNDLRIAYVQHVAGAEWGETLRGGGYTVAARELHVLYESEGMPGETFTGAMRYLRREGKASVLEERLVESVTGRPIARAWLVHLIVHDGTVVDWPEEYFDRVSAFEGHAIERRARAAREWGPGE
jgi:acyl-CoA thioesterase FadM